MSPMEAVCRAMRDSEPGMEDKDWRYWLPSARAALLALADSQCPREELLPHGYTPRHWTMMRSLLRVVAEYPR